VVDSGCAVRHILRMRTVSKPASVRRRLLTIVALAVAACALAVSGAVGAASKPVVFSDPNDDVGGALDLTRASLQRAADGRLRAAVTFARTVTAKTLLATSGPPGSACLRIWTAADADPEAARPDRLVCVTARSDDELRGGVYEAPGAELPKRLGDASVRRNASGRSLVIRFAQSLLARPKRIRFGVESTRPGCERASCIDTAPDKGAVRTFRLR
jgi:hypothetical protein